MKKILQVFAVLACAWLISAMVGFRFAYLEDTRTNAPGSIHIEHLAERLKNNETRLYYMAVAEIKDGRARLAREDGQQWWINDFGFYQFEHVLVEMDEHGTYAYEDDTVKNVWRFE